MRPCGRLAQKLVILGLAAMLLACTAARIGYNNGEMITYWWLDSYVDFEDQQKPWVKSHIDELFAWHRKTQLQEYVRLLSGLQRADFATITKADLLADYDAASANVMTITGRAAPDLADLALSLTPDQIANIQEKLDKNNDKFRKDYLRGSVQERQDFRYRRMMKQADYWFGDFSKAQAEQLRTLSDARPLNNELVLADRELREQKLLALLRQIHDTKPTREQAAQWIRAYVAAAMGHFGNKDMQAYFAASHGADAELVAQMMHMATPDQKRHFIDTLQDWITDFNRLMAKANS